MFLVVVLCFVIGVVSLILGVFCGDRDRPRNYVQRIFGGAMMFVVLVGMLSMFEEVDRMYMIIDEIEKWETEYVWIGDTINDVAGVAELSENEVRWACEDIVGTLMDRREEITEQIAALRLMQSACEENISWPFDYEKM